MNYLSIFLFNILYHCDSYRVLLVFPIPGKSHSILGEGYVNNLLEAGHEVTYITPIPMKNSSPRLKQIDVSENFQFLIADIYDVQKYMYNEMDLQDQFILNTVLHDFLYKTLQTRPIQNFINDPEEEFDAVVVEWLYSELGAGFASVFNCSLIWSSSMMPSTLIISLIDEYFNPAYTGFHLSKDCTLSFWQRVRDLWLVSRLRLYNWLYREKNNEEFKSMFGFAIAKRGYLTPDFQDVKYSGSLVLGNSDSIMTENVALPQNYKHIGGYHINNTIEPLPKDLKELLEEAKHGVIYFSLGSMLKTNNIPKKTVRELLDTFSLFNQTVIWKLEEKIPDLPKNVYIISWAPQLSILAHHNCVLFITHGGLLSTFESIYFGIPLIGIPFYGDQFQNVDKVVTKGFGKRINFDEDTPEKLKHVIKDILKNPRYRQRAKEMSVIFKDRMLPPGKELVYWIEYVIRTDGAPHMRSAALNVKWYEKLYLDLLMVVLIVLILIILLVKYILYKISLAIDLKKKVL